MNKYLHNWKNYNLLENAKQAPVEGPVMGPIDHGDPKQRETVSARAERKMNRCRVRLGTKQPFFGNLIAYLNMERHSNLEFKTMATDGKNLYYDPNFVLKHTDEEIMWVICHEVMHCALKHFLRRQADPSYWNAAADYALNQLISDLPDECGQAPDGGLGSPSDTTKAPDGKFVKEKVIGWSAEMTYHYLLENNIDLPPVEKWDFGRVGDPGSFGPGDGGGSNSGQPDQGQSQPEEGDGKGAGADQADKGFTLKDEDLNDPEKLARFWEKNLKESMEKSAGKLPGNFLRTLKKLTQPKIDWKSKLKRFIISVGEKHKYTLPDRRFIGGGDVQWARANTKSAFDTMIVIADTSGSIGDTELTAMVSECAKIMSDFKPKEIYLMWCDSILHLPVEKVTKQSMYKFNQPRGGGGTDFRPPFEWIEKNLLGKKEMGPIIYFTDAAGSFPQANQYGIPRYREKILWCIVGTDGYVENTSIPTGIGTKIDLVL